ncbi:MAG: N-6 DNA methylase [Gammaproteobacteria bacterium]|nr:N-6 DNA methylase [Gammaproteobacteria bacterium]
MDMVQIENKLSGLVKHISDETFVFDFLRAYGVAKSEINLMRFGKLNPSKKDDQLIYRNKLLFQKATSQDIDDRFATLCDDLTEHKNKPRLILTTDFKRLLAFDNKTNKKIDIHIKNLNDYCSFFESLSPGMVNERKKNEYAADLKAAEKMAKLYDKIQKDNQFKSKQEEHDLNIFFSRLIFCFFAEDIKILSKNTSEEVVFTSYIYKYTKEDGSDLDKKLNELFRVLNTEEELRKNTQDYLNKFQYVDGSLFNNGYHIPKFTGKSRKMIIECGDIDWSEINLDIFGSMMQAVVNKKDRSRLGMHYTSLENIMKVIKPLFLDELEEEFNKNKSDPGKLNNLLQRLTKIRIFDPACGSGNFLTITYKELCKLEMEILECLRYLDTTMDIPFSVISLRQFYGIEVDDFVREIATLSLSLSKIQFNKRFQKKFNKSRKSLPLDKKNNIYLGNATHIDWENICPKEKGYEIYIVGNPPYQGHTKQGKQQKKDMDIVFKNNGNYKNLDYISCWFLKGSEYIANTTYSLAFLTTKSICQGEQVHVLWPKIFSKCLEISFCYKPFNWINFAKNNAGVTCSIIGLSSKKSTRKKIYSSGRYKEVNRIGPYLSESNIDTMIIGRRQPLSNIPTMVFGNMPRDGGHLLLSKNEMNEIIKKNMLSKKYIKRALGSREFINDIRQWCLWIKDNEVNDAIKNPLIKSRLEQVSIMRNASKANSTRAFSKKPHRFIQISHKETSAIIVPRVSSEKRHYIPIGFIEKGIIVKDRANVIYDAQLWLFGILTSQMHMAWVRAVACSLKNDYSYSATLCYNTFPIPELSDKQKNIIEHLANNVLAERENHSERTLAELYDPKKIPLGLKKAHEQLDLVVDQCYRSKPFASDDERLELLFKLYDEMIANEKAENNEKKIHTHKVVKKLAHKMNKDEHHQKKLTETVSENVAWYQKRKKRA